MSNLLAAVPRAQGQGWAITATGRKYIRRSGCGNVFYTEHKPGSKGIYPEDGHLDGEKVIAEGDGKPEWCLV